MNNFRENICVGIVVHALRVFFRKHRLEPGLLQAIDRYANILTQHNVQRDCILHVSLFEI